MREGGVGTRLQAGFTVAAAAAVARIAREATRRWKCRLPTLRLPLLHRTMSLVVRRSTRSYFLCLTKRSTATSTDFCMRLEMTCGAARRDQAEREQPAGGGGGSGGSSSVQRWRPFVARRPLPAGDAVRWHCLARQGRVLQPPPAPCRQTRSPSCLPPLPEKPKRSRSTNQRLPVCQRACSESWSLALP